ncbi:hypothetical protein GCM10007895_25910 [Paraferrimonas sedimenticola]|uniref:Uncharacterized protein n=1 Tax=Paraferrimonas sedimenticola TaxID=375674 RepID=A0AA37VZJ6_9GAMM|nr:hypothetical protein GCM10007895_25910 [Paraferrimonas sedimenticola]
MSFIKANIGIISVMLLLAVAIFGGIYLVEESLANQTVEM